MNEDVFPRIAAALERIAEYFEREEAQTAAIHAQTLAVVREANDRQAREEARHHPDAATGTVQ